MNVILFQWIIILFSGLYLSLRFITKNLKNHHLFELFFNFNHVHLHKEKRLFWKSRLVNDIKKKPARKVAACSTQTACYREKMSDGFDCSILGEEDFEEDEEEYWLLPRAHPPAREWCHRSLKYYSDDSNCSSSSSSHTDQPNRFSTQRSRGNWFSIFCTHNEYTQFFSLFFWQQ